MHRPYLLKGFMTFLEMSEKSITLHAPIESDKCYCLVVATYPTRSRRFEVVAIQSRNSAFEVSDRLIVSVYSARQPQIWCEWTVMLLITRTTRTEDETPNELTMSRTVLSHSNIGSASPTSVVTNHDNQKRLVSEL